jgi:hypothetical protein
VCTLKIFRDISHKEPKDAPQALRKTRTSETPDQQMEKVIMIKVEITEVEIKRMIQ